MAQQDIAPMLREQIQQDFFELLGDADFSGTDYAAAEDYAEKVGSALAEAFRRNLTATTVCIIGKMEIRFMPRICSIVSYFVEI